MVSSPVYGIEELLERIYTLLTAFGYEVWMSHKGTTPVFSNKSAFENCITAVKKCDLFLGIITPNYGSGINEQEEFSITHKELKKALEMNKPRWILSHEHVVFARSLLNDLGYSSLEKRKKLKLKNTSKVFTDLRIIDMYEEAIIDEKDLKDRQGNWVQKYKSDNDALVFATAQFSRFQEVENFIQENFKNSKKLTSQIQNKRGKK